MLPAHCTHGAPCPELMIAFPFLFAGLWLVVMAFLAKLGGWQRLVEQYRLTDRFLDGHMPEGQEINWNSAVFSKSLPVNYNGCINLTFNSEGLGLAPMLIFSMWHPPLFIPWRDIDLSETKSWGRRMAMLRIADTGVKIKFWRKSVVEMLMNTHPKAGQNNAAVS